jgi:glycosyltransferase involved in cell wall biosynthesis
MSARVSIITTVYDRVPCLARCLRSVDHLTYPDLEQIVVSDAPAGRVVSAIAQLVSAAPRVSRYINLPIRTNDWGHSPAVAGLLSAAGEYVCFLSDDNAYLPDHFGPLVEALDADAGLGFVYASCLYAGRKVLRHAPPVGAGIDLGQPLFRRAMLRDLFGDTLPGHGVFSWDWELIHALLARQVRWQHVDVASFIFRLAAYPRLVEALA